MVAVPVDVVIAARNEALRLPDCLAAVRSQQYPEGLIRCIVVDDGSTDATAEVAGRARATVVPGAGRGAAAARNAGIRLGHAPLVAFLDAHSIPAPDWVATLAARFADPRLGGCQAAITNRATDQRVDAHLAHSGVHGNDEIVDHTVAAKRSLYPWVLTGNCMYRRRALDDVGLFDASLVASEDVDLAWRVVLAGWLLDYEPGTHVVHHEGKPWSAFLRKGWRYGRGAAQLTAAYAPHGAKGKFGPRGLWRPSGAETVSNLYYWAGFTVERLNRWHRPVPRHIADVARFRDPFPWTDEMTIRISRRAVYWLRGPASIVVQLDRRERIVLDRVGGFVWRRLAASESRADVVAAVVATYAVPAVTAASDLDDLVEELLALGLVESVAPEPASPGAALGAARIRG